MKKFVVEIVNLSNLSETDFIEVEATDAISAGQKAEAERKGWLAVSAELK